MNGLSAVGLVVLNLIGAEVYPVRMSDPDPQVDMLIYCTVGVPELPTAQPFAIGRSGDQNETTNLAITTIVDGRELRVLGAIGFCGWSRVSATGVDCGVDGGRLSIDADGAIEFRPDPCNRALTGEALARHLGMVVCGRQVWWKRVTL